MRVSSLSSDPPRRSVLVVDDNAGTRETTVSVLRCLNMSASEADTGAAAIAAVRARPYDLALIDFRLPDISGLDVVVELKKARLTVPWLLMSGLMTPPLAVEAMRLGALDAVELPFDVEKVVVTALGALAAAPASDANGWPPLPAASVLPRPKSAAERWACLVLRGCECDSDLKTIREWASVAGISYSALTESCRLVGIRPYDARDFLRMLRALAHTGGRVAHLEHRLDVNDHRTLRTLFERAGLSRDGAAGIVSLRAFIDHQQFVDPECEAVRWMLKVIADSR